MSERLICTLALVSIVPQMSISLGWRRLLSRCFHDRASPVVCLTLRSCRPISVGVLQ